MTQITQPAFPIMPIQDNFKRLIVPVPGLNKLEHFALELYKVYKNCQIEIEYSIVQQDEHNEAENEPKALNDFIMENAIQDAITFLNLLEEKTKLLNNEKNNEVAIFNS
jgi:hypothetical protein